MTALAKITLPNIGAAIRRKRDNRRIGIREAARQLGMSPTTLCRMERGGNVQSRILIDVLNWAEALPPLKE